jgi:hypothetical protein
VKQRLIIDNRTDLPIASLLAKAYRLANADGQIDFPGVICFGDDVCCSIYKNKASDRLVFWRRSHDRNN